MDVQPTEPQTETKSVPSETIKVSNKRSLFYYVSESAKSLAVHDKVEVSGLGSVVTIVEILKNQGVCSIKNRRVQKPKIEIIIVKSDTFDKVQAARNLLQEENAEIHAALNKAQKALQDQLREEAKAAEQPK